MYIKTLVTLARSEILFVLRLPRTKVVLLVTTLVNIAFYVLVELQYVFRAAESASVGIISPSYIAASLGSYFLALYCLAIVLLAHDLRERYFRDKINEVLEVIPASNVTLVLGQLLGLVLLFAVPVILFVTAIILYGWIAEIAGLGYGNLIELHSVGSFLVWDLVPNLAFIGSMTIYLSTIIRSNVTVLLFMLTCIVAVFWLFLRLPLDVSGVLLTTTGVTLFPSEIAPRFVSAEIVVNRLSLLLFAAGFVLLAGCCWRRPLKNRKYFTVVGLSSCMLGILIIGSALFGQQLRHQKVQSWVYAHDALEQSTFPDITHISGNIEIVPSRTVVLDLTVDLVAPVENTRDFVVLALNPGYRISKLWVGDKEVDDYRFDKGILQVPIDSDEWGTISVRMKARGRPDARFAYLDASIKTNDIAGAKVRNLFAMGTESYIFHPSFVVLTSGIKWYPTSGAATGEGELDVRPRDLYTVNLKVSVPKAWLVAGPGHRQLISTSMETKSIYRIESKNPVPEICLVSSNFERASTEVEGIEFEMLFSKRHQRRFRELSEIEKPLRVRISSILYRIKEHGLIYPYETFSLIEVPTSLRVFGGGWKMDTILGPPGMVLMRESSLPNTNVSIAEELDFQNIVDMGGYSESQQMGMQWAGTALSSYFNGNVFGEHPAIGFARNFVGYQTSTTGPGARMLSHVIEETVQRLIFDNSIFLGDRIRTNPSRSFIFEVALANAQRSVFDLFDIGRNEPIKNQEEQALKRYGSQSSVWNDLELFSLGALTFEQAPLRSYRVVRLKSMAISRIILDLLGRKPTATLFGHLSSTYTGKSYDYDDLLREATHFDIDLKNTFGDWLNAKGLPGFIVAEPSITRLPDSDKSKVFQASLTVHNAEPYDGFATVSWIHKGWHGNERERTRAASSAFLVRGNKSVQLSVTTLWPQPIDVVYIEPYLSLNRDAIRIDVPEDFDVDTIVDAAARPYVVDISWSPPHTPAIIVDDLDETFEIVYDVRQSKKNPVAFFLRDVLGKFSVEEWDRGVPLYVPEHGKLPPTHRWVRRSDVRAHGKYRHTYTFVNKGTTNRLSYAKFTAKLPAAGRWQLDYHLPVEALDPNDREAHILLSQEKPIDWHKRFPPGTTKVIVQIGEKTHTIDFDAEAAKYGWNTVSEFEVDSQLTEVWITGASDKQTIYADAIRWVPFEGADDKP